MTDFINIHLAPTTAEQERAASAYIRLVAAKHEWDDTAEILAALGLSGVTA